MKCVLLCDSVSPWWKFLRFSRRVLFDLLQLFRELVYEDRLLPVGTGGDHADPRAALALHEAQIFLRLLRQLVELGDALGGLLPSRHLLVDALDLVVTADIGRNFRGFLSVDL